MFFPLLNSLKSAAQRFGMPNYFASQDELLQIQDLVDQITPGMQVLDYKNQNLMIGAKRLAANQFKLSQNQFSLLWQKSLKTPLPKHIFYKIK